MRQAGEGELGAGMELGFDKTAEERGRGGPIEAMIVIQNSHAHEKGMENLLVSRKWGEICKCPSFRVYPSFRARSFRE